MKGKVLVLSRTPWNETPRIRHQLTRLLRDEGYEMHYVEILFHKPISDGRPEEGIRVFSVNELIHHQLKPLHSLSLANNTFVKKRIANILPADTYDLVINFNYDNDFNSELFPSVPVITILNDDFIALAKPWMKNAAKRMLIKTIAASDYTLSVSYSIHRFVEAITEKSDILLPWANSVYKAPGRGKERDVVLYYGFISRLNIEIAEQLITSGIKVRFVGPIQGNGKVLKSKFEKYKNVEFLNARPLNEVLLDDVCCSIALYNITDESTNAITASNRMFQLLALGIPLIYPNMPNLIEAPGSVLKKYNNIEELSVAISFFSKNFYGVQKDIEFFLQDHTIQKRKQLIAKIIETIKA
jgi:hypothetical protein